MLGATRSAGTRYGPNGTVGDRDRRRTIRAVDIQRMADDIDGQLSELGDPVRADKERAYLKSDRLHHGVSMPAIRRVAVGAARTTPLPHDQLIALVGALWAKPAHECRVAAAELLEHRVDDLEPGDIELLERLLRESGTWALVDGLAASVVGPLVDAHPELGAVLDRWAVDDDFWIRRSALLALLLPLRRGAGDFERFGRYADAMLDDTEFFIRKAIGWVLRDTAKKRPDLVYEWILPRAARASGVTLREVRKPLSDVQRATLEASR